MSPVSQLINKDLIKTAFEKYFKKNIDVLNLTVDNLSASGENYCSNVKKIIITYSFENKKEERVLSVIAKYLPEDEKLANFIREMRFFDCELSMYGGFFPELSKLDYREKVSPQVYYVSSMPRPVVILEDLSSMNYKLQSRKEGLDLEHSFLVVEKLAYLHAASVALYERDSRKLLNYNRSLFQNTKQFSLILDISYEELIKACDRHSEFNIYVEKLRTNKKNICDKLFNSHNINANFKVLNHGDCWVNNILFYYNVNGSLADLAFIDFQASCYSSPCLDLHYFLACSIKSSIKHHYNLIIDCYFQNLIKNLNKLHTKTIPKREEFDEDFRSTAYYGFGASMTLLPPIKATRTENASVENYISDNGIDGFRYHCFHNIDYIKEMSHFLPFFDELGIFKKQ